MAARIPDDRLSDVVFFDPSEDETAIGWNILGAESEVEKDLLASDLVGVFRRLSTSWGDQMTAVLAERNINVIDMLNKSRGDVAYNLIDVADEPVPELIDDICAIDSVLNVREFAM